VPGPSTGGSVRRKWPASQIASLLVVPYEHDESLIMRATVIAGIRYADDYAVTWRGLSIGRIMKAIGAASDKQQWAWNCYIHGRPSSADDSGTGHDLENAKAKFRQAWARIRAGLTELDIARARHYAEASREALARYDRKR
jgi:hypothetical protein